MGQIFHTLLLATTVFLSGIVRTSTGAPIEAIPTNSTAVTTVTSSVPESTTTSGHPLPTAISCADESACPNSYQCQDGLSEHLKKCGGIVGIECPDGHFCLTPPGTADLYGVCIKIPDFPLPSAPTPTDTSIVPSISSTTVFPTNSASLSATASSVSATTTSSDQPTPTGSISCTEKSACPDGYQCEEGRCELPKKCGGFVGIACPDGYFCLTPPGTADAFGTCIEIPKFPLPPCPEPRYCIDPSCEIQICPPPVPQVENFNKPRLSRRQDPGVVFWTSSSPEPTPIETDLPVYTEVIPLTPVSTPSPINSQNATTTSRASEIITATSIAGSPTMSTQTPIPSNSQ